MFEFYKARLFVVYLTCTGLTKGLIWIIVKIWRLIKPNLITFDIKIINIFLK